MTLCWVDQRGSHTGRNHIFVCPEAGSPKPLNVLQLLRNVLLSRPADCNVVCELWCGLSDPVAGGSHGPATGGTAAPRRPMVAPGMFAVDNHPEMWDRASRPCVFQVGVVLPYALMMIGRNCNFSRRPIMFVIFCRFCPLYELYSLSGRPFAVNMKQKCGFCPSAVPAAVLKPQSRFCGHSGCALCDSGRTLAFL